MLARIFVEGHRVSTARVPSRILCPKECNWPFLSPSFPFSCPPTIDTAAVTRGTLCTRGSRVFQLVHARPSPDALARRCPPRVPVPEIGSHAHSRSHRAIHYQHEKLLVHHRVVQLRRSREWPAATTRVHLIFAPLFCSKFWLRDTLLSGNGRYFTSWM